MFIQRKISVMRKIYSSNPAAAKILSFHLVQWQCNMTAGAKETDSRAMLETTLQKLLSPFTGSVWIVEFDTGSGCMQKMLLLHRLDSEQKQGHTANSYCHRH
jgi:hypothetical protein